MSSQKLFAMMATFLCLIDSGQFIGTMIPYSGLMVALR